MSKVYVNDGYMMLLDAIYFNGKKIGNVSDDGIDWGKISHPDGIAVFSCPVGIATVNFPMRKPVSILGGISLPPAQNELSHVFDLPQYR